MVVKQGNLKSQTHIIYDLINETKDYLTSNTIKKEVVKIGVPNSFARLHLPKLLSSYIENDDRLEFITVPISSNIIVNQVLDGTIDVGIICGDFPYIGYKEELFDEELYILAPKNSSMEDIYKLPLIYSYLNPLVKTTVEQWWYRYYGTKFHASHVVPYSEIAIEMVENGLGCCFIFGKEWRWDINKVELIPVLDILDKQTSRKVWIILSNRAFQNNYIKEFAEFCKNFYNNKSHSN